MNEVTVEEVDLEELAREGRPVPLARRYRIRIDRQHYVVVTATITGRELLALAGKTPETHKLYQHRRGHQPLQIEPAETVSLRDPGVERFTTMPKDTTEGIVSANLCREFRLPAEDEAFLNGLGLTWECICDNGSQWLIIHDWQIPEGYVQSNASLALLIPPNYSDSQIDMVYFRPEIGRKDGVAIRALAGQTIKGESWQRWSRHRSGANPWRPGQDDIASHLCLVDEWLRRELAL